MKKKQNKGIAHRLGTRYVSKGTNQITSEQGAYILNETQRKEIKKISFETYFWAALIGALAVLIVVLPHVLFKNLFGIQTFQLFGIKIEFELYYTIYAIFMLFPEIWMLNFINLRAVKKICLICKYPASQRQDYQEQISLLAEAGLEIPSKHLDRFQINPFLGLSKFSYYSLLILNKLKATLSNVIMKLLVKRFLGRYALRIVTDTAGIPLFAFWNAWASRSVIKETKMRIMATSATNDFLQDINFEQVETIKPKLGLIFNYVAQQKRSYNFALYAFVNEFVKHVPDIQMKINKEVKLEELFTDNEENNKLISKLLVFGFIVDGSLNIKERLSLTKLNDATWFTYSTAQLDVMIKNYVDGKGLPDFN